mgnify:CR=1 FL=1
MSLRKCGGILHLNDKSIGRMMNESPSYDEKGFLFFKSMYGLPADGIYGTKTKAKLESLLH